MSEKARNMKVQKSPQYAGVEVLYILREGSDEWGWDDFEARGFFTYPRGSVLEGQQQEVCVASSPDLDALQAEYPGVTYEADRAKCEVKPVVPTSPPADFDFYDAGEHWSEEDY